MKITVGKKETRIISDYSPGYVFQWDGEYWMVLDNLSGFTTNIPRSVYDDTKSRLAVQLVSGKIFVFDAFEPVEMIPDAELIV